jgi:hypothetical protein
MPARGTCSGTDNATFPAVLETSNLGTEITLQRKVLSGPFLMLEIYY